MVSKIVKIMQKNTVRKLFCCLLAITTVTAVGINFENTAEVVIKSNFVNNIYNILNSFQGWGIGQFLYVIGLTYIYEFYCKNHNFQKYIAVFSCFLSLLMLMGMCYQNEVGIALIVQNFAQVVKSCIVILGYSSMFYCAIFWLHIWMQKLIQNIKTENHENKVQGKHYIFKVASFIFICWLPYLIVYYPGAPSYDAISMLEQFFGYRPLTNANPYLQTLLIGIFVQIGNYFASASVGVFLYILLQVCSFIMVVAYMANLLKNIGIPKIIIRILVCIYALVPTFPLYAITIGKNTNFAIGVLLLTIFLFEVSRNPDVFVHNTPKMVLLAVVLLLICLFRNEGIFFLVGFAPCFISLAKKYRKVFFGIFTSVLFLVVLWLKCFLPFCGVQKGSSAEALSIPFMQTARCVYYYGEEMTEEEIEVIDRILQFDTLTERYAPEISDDVKAKYNKYATDEELREYLKVYFHQFLKYPITYVDAVLNKSYGYLYPDDKGKIRPYWSVTLNFPDLDKHEFKFRPEFLTEISRSVFGIWERSRNIPLLGYTTSIGFYFWCTFLSMFFIIRFKNRRLLYLFVPAMISLLVCVASPVNAYFRYGLSVVFAVPFYAAIVIYSLISAYSNEESRDMT